MRWGAEQSGEKGERDENRKGWGAVAAPDEHP